MGSPEEELDRLIADALPCRDERAERFLPQLMNGPGVLAVVFYGSRLARIGAADSEPDFFVVVDGLRRYHGPGARGLGAALLGGVLPPSTYRARVVAEGRTLGAKVCVISASQLRRQTSPAADDLHHLGRFSKRIGLLPGACRGQGAALVASARRSALLALAPHALALLPESFSLDDFLHLLLGISYRGEPRVVEPGKVERLLAADLDHYRAVARAVLAARHDVASLGGDAYAQPPPELAAREVARDVTLQLIARSRRRALLRWPKHLVTFDGWLDYVLAKIERHTGRALPLSPRARRHPLIFGWADLLRLRQQGLLR